MDFFRAWGESDAGKSIKQTSDVLTDIQNRRLGKQRLRLGQLEEDLTAINITRAKKDLLIQDHELELKRIEASKAKRNEQLELEAFKMMSAEKDVDEIGMFPEMGVFVPGVAAKVKDRFINSPYATPKMGTDGQPVAYKSSIIKYAKFMDAEKYWIGGALNEGIAELNAQIAEGTVIMNAEADPKKKAFYNQYLERLKLAKYRVQGMTEQYEKDLLKHEEEKAINQKYEAKPLTPEESKKWFGTDVFAGRTVKEASEAGAVTTAGIKGKEQVEEWNPKTGETRMTWVTKGKTYNPEGEWQIGKPSNEYYTNNKITPQQRISTLQKEYDKLDELFTKEYSGILGSIDFKEYQRSWENYRDTVAAAREADIKAIQAGEMPTAFSEIRKQFFDKTSYLNYKKQLLQSSDKLTKFYKADPRTYETKIRKAYEARYGAITTSTVAEEIPELEIK